MTIDRDNFKKKISKFSSLTFLFTLLGMVLVYDGIKVLSPPASFVFETLGIVLILVSMVAYRRQHIRKKKAEKNRL